MFFCSNEAIAQKLTRGKVVSVSHVASGRKRCKRPDKGPYVGLCDSRTPEKHRLN